MESGAYQQVLIANLLQVHVSAAPGVGNSVHPHTAPLQTQQKKKQQNRKNYHKHGIGTG